QAEDGIRDLIVTGVQTCALPISGGHIVFQGPFKRLLKCPRSLTGQYLSGAKEIEMPSPRPVKLSTPRLKLSGVNRNNLRDLALRSEERRVGKEGGSWWAPSQ